MPLSGRSILLVEDERLIAMDVTATLSDAGALVTTANTLKQALEFARKQRFSCAVLDHSLPDGDSDPLCEELAAHGTPFVLYTGRSHIGGACATGKIVGKPVGPNELVDAIRSLC
jgi:DNA-binding response OmpR family regulator